MGSIASAELRATAGIAVVRQAGEYRLLTLRGAAPDELLFTIGGRLTDVPSRHSVQVGPDLHVDLPGGFDLEEVMDRFFWRYMNHSCEPAVAVRGYDVTALRELAPGSEITFDYNTTEYQLAEPFACRCGSSRCGGQVQGFRFLSRAERFRLRPLLAPHLLAVIDEVSEPVTSGGEPQCR